MIETASGQGARSLTVTEDSTVRLSETLSIRRHLPRRTLAALPDVRRFCSAAAKT